MTDENNNKPSEEKKQVNKNISIEEMYTSGIGEQESLDAYKKQISENSVFQLRTILANIDQEKFPSRAKIIQEVIDIKLGDAPPPTEEEIAAQEEEIKKEEIKKIQKKEAELKKKREAKTNDQKTKFYFKLTIYVILISMYILLCTFVDLPGKNYIMMLAK